VETFAEMSIARLVAVFLSTMVAAGGALNGADKPPAQGEPERTKTVFTVTNTTSADRADETIISGVPLRQGHVTDPTSVVLRDSSGRRVPCQGQALARWADGSVKWLLLTVPCFSIKAAETATLNLTAAGAAETQGMKVVETEKGLRVDTGTIRFTIAAKGPLVPLFESRAGEKWVARAVDLDLAMTVENERQKVRYLASLAPRTVKIEQRGPLRTLIRVRGTHQAQHGQATFGPYTLRFEILSGSTQLRLTHSFVYDGDPYRDFVRASEVVFKARVGSSRYFGFGGDDGRELRLARQRADWAPDFRYAELCQDSGTHWRLRRWVDIDRREVFAAEGLRADGWMELGGHDGRLAVAVRNYWQNHPKALFADAETGLMRVGLYPRNADRLDLRRYSDKAYPWTYEHPAFKGTEPVAFDRSCGAHGIRKTHDLMLLFDEPNPSGKTLCYNRPLRLQWTPRYMAATGVVVPAAARIDKVWLGRTNAFLDFLHEQMLTSGGTGYLDYFDLPHGFDLASGRWFHDFGGFGYANDEAMPCLGLWQAYLLTGRDDAFEMAGAMARHNADIDSYHLGKYAGFGSRHNVNHWGDMCKERRISQPIGKRFGYYLTGDRSVLDLAQIVFRSYRATGRAGMTADVPALVATLLLLDEAGLVDGEKWLRSIAGALADSVDDRGRMADLLRLDFQNQTAEAIPNRRPLSFMMFSCFGGAQAFAELAERYDHEPLRQALVRFARYQMLSSDQRSKLVPAGYSIVRSDDLLTFRALDLLAYAYSVTRAPAFRDHFRAHTKTVAVEIVRQDQTRYGVKGAGKVSVPVLVGWPDQKRKRSKFYPLFPPSSMSQFFNMSVYLHKMQGIMILAAGD